MTLPASAPVKTLVNQVFGRVQKAARQRAQKAMAVFRAIPTWCSHA
jgi:hypothetical protein